MKKICFFEGKHNKKIVCLIIEGARKEEYEKGTIICFYVIDNYSC